jgi:hypothetical protein
MYLLLLLIFPECLLLIFAEQSPWEKLTKAEERFILSK